MNSRVLKTTIVLLAGLLLLGTAGAVSADTVGNLSISLSTGEITDTAKFYTGYIDFTPVAAYDMNAFRFVITSDDPAVVFSESSKKDALFTGNDKFTYAPLNNSKLPYAVTGTLESGTVNVTVAAKEKIAPFTIHVGATNNETVNISFTMDTRDTYVSNMTGESLFPGELGGITYMLNNATPNSVKPKSTVDVDIETNETVFDDSVSIFSELTKLMANSSSEYFLNYTSSKEDVIKFYNYNNASLNMTPRYVVLKGSNTSEITVNLTNASGVILDSKQFTVNTKKIDITADMFYFTADHTYGYSAGKSVASQVLNDVKAAFLNHSVGAADAGDDAAVYGYPRETGEIRLTFFNSSGVKMEPIESDTYTFNISIAGNDNYNEVTDLQIANHSFTINGAVIRGVSIPLNQSYFNATTPAKMVVEFNATGQNLSAVYFDQDTKVSEYRYFFAHYNLSYNSTNYPYLGVNCNVTNGNQTILFDNATTHPVQAVTYFDFVGFPRGDVNMDGIVRGGDSTLLARYIANLSGSSLTEEQKFYANVKGSEKLSGNDVRLIALYAFGSLDADYLDVK